MEKVLLDTDIGGDIDDAVCLAYLLKEPRCDLLGITTVCGDSEKRAAVADAICMSAGRDVPIVAGYDTTLQPIPLYPTPDGACALDRWPHTHYKQGDAPAFLYQKIAENPHEVVLIGIGNMTNIATLFRSYPDAPGLLKGLSVMNGYFGAEPLPEPYYNWNSWADPLASAIVFGCDAANHKAIPLEVTDGLAMDAEKAGSLFACDSRLMKAVLDFESTWLESVGKLTLHDPLAAISVFYPDICGYERGTVRVETAKVGNMGGTEFFPNPDGNVEIARSVDRERFYRILSAALNDRVCHKGKGDARKRSVPPAVVSRAKASGPVGELWLQKLDALVDELETQWGISVEESLPGGTHAYAAGALGRDGKRYVLKIDLPDTMGHGEFLHSINVLKTAGGQGYAKLYEYDTVKRACLLERLGNPLKDLNYPVRRQLQLICGALEKSWEIPVCGAALPDGDDSIAWFRDFICSTWEELHRPCTRKVVERAMDFLRCRESRKEPATDVLLHGDAHSTNTLQDLTAQDSFRLIDPDGIFYEKAYDLGVLMREWPEDYKADPVARGLKRCGYLHQLTGVDRQAIWQWGFLQMVSTALVLLRIGQEQTGRELLDIAEQWRLLESP